MTQRTDQESKPAGQVHYDLDLSRLGAALWARKGMIIAVAAAFLLLGALYAFTATPVYQASAELVVPLPEDLAGELSVADLELTFGEQEQFLTRLSAFKRGLMQLEDPHTQQAAFLELQSTWPEIGGPITTGEAEFLDSIELLKPALKHEQTRTLAVEHENPEFAAAAVQALIAQANIGATQLLTQEIRYEMIGRSKLLENRLRHTRELAAATTAVSPQSASAAHLAEELTELQLRIATLQDYIDQDYPVVNMVVKEGQISRSTGPVWPHKPLVLVLSTLFGLFTGLCIAAARSAVQDK